MKAYVQMFHEDVIGSTKKEIANKIAAMIQDRIIDDGRSAVFIGGPVVVDEYKIVVNVRLELQERDVEIK